MSQQHPFPSHLPRGAVTASAMLGKSTVLRPPAIQIPAAPSVSSVSVTGHPALQRNPVISAMRSVTPPTTRAPSPAVSMTDHPRTNLIVQGAPAGGAALPGQPLQITLTQRVNPGAPTVGMVNPGASAVGIPEAIKLGPKTVQVPQPGLLQHQKVAAAGAQPAPGSLTGIGMAPHLPQQAVLTVSKPGGLQVSAAVPAVSITSLSAPMATATAMAPASTSIPIAKVTPQRQQMPLPAGIPAQIAVQAVTCGTEFTASDLGAMGTQAGASQLLLSQTQRSQAGTVVTATTGVTLSTAMPATVTSLAGHGERALGPTMFNLMATGQGQDNVLLSHIFYQQAAHAQLVSASTIRPPPTNQFFVPRPGADQTKITSQTPNLAASLSHPLNPSQPTMLLSAHNLRQPLPLSAATTTLTAVSLSASTVATGVSSEGKPVISLSTTSGGQGALHTSLIAASTPAASSQADPSSFPSSSSLNMAANLASGNTGVSVLSPNLGLSAITSLPSRATVASSIIAAASAHQVQAASSLQPQAPGTPSSSSTANPSASPRPSILRKRTVDGNTAIPRKPNFSLMAESHSPRPDTAPPSNISSPKTPATENSQSSTDTALSSNDATTPTHTSQGDIKVKSEPLDAGENGPPVASPAVSLGGSITDASPRKRARKQLFDVSHRNVNEEVKGNSSSDDEEMDCKAILKDIKVEHPLECRDEFIDEDGVRWTRERTKPTMSIMSDYAFNWKPKYNHFQRHSDVRPKDDRNPTVNELISQRGILQKASGWKLYYVSSQVEDVIENEESMEQRMEKLKERLSAKTVSHGSMEYDYNKLLELTRGNLQRCQVVRQQLLEAKTNMLNILKHEPKIKEIIHKNLAKRTIKKKERT